MFSGENSGLRTYNVVITDGIVIGGQEIYHKPYSERYLSFTCLLNVNIINNNGILSNLYRS